MSPSHIVKPNVHNFESKTNSKKNPDHDTYDTSGKMDKKYAQSKFKEWFFRIKIFDAKKKNNTKILIKKKMKISYCFINYKKFKDNKLLEIQQSSTIFNDSKADEIILIDLDHSILDENKLSISIFYTHVWWRSKNN